MSHTFTLVYKYDHVLSAINSSGLVSLTFDIFYKFLGGCFRPKSFSNVCRFLINNSAHFSLTTEFRFAVLKLPFGYWSGHFDLSFIVKYKSLTFILMSPCDTYW